MRILLVEDDIYTQEILQAALTEQHVDHWFSIQAIHFSSC